MFGIVNYFGFLASSVLLNLTPGADTLYILSRSLSGGKRQGVASALGISTGILIHTLLVALGLSILLANSLVSFHVMKWLGAGYLMFLGIRTLFSKTGLLENSGQTRKISSLRVYFQGVLTNALNPKVALFFLALLPQFVEANQPFGALPFILLGCTFFITSTLWSLVLAVGASLLHGWLVKNEKTQQIMTKLSGMVYVILGLNLLRAKISA